MTTMRKMGRTKFIEKMIEQLCLEFAGLSKRVFDLEQAVIEMNKAEEQPCANEAEKDQPK